MQKSKKDDPKWFMVDLTFVSRAEHFIPLTLLRYISETSELPPQIAYIGESGFAALKSEFLALFDMNLSFHPTAQTWTSSQGVG